MWKLLITKGFFKQFLKLPKDKQSFILDSLHYLRNTLDLEAEYEIDIIDEYEAEGKRAVPFPITYAVDDTDKIVYLICIEENFMKDRNFKNTVTKKQ